MSEDEKALEDVLKDLKWVLELASEFTKDEMMDPFYAMDKEQEKKLRKLIKKYKRRD